MAKDKYIEGFRWLAIYQIAGGIIGLYFFVFRDLLIYLDYQVFPAFTFFLAALLFSYSVFCGIILLQRRAKALEYSLVNQYIQIVGFAGSGLIYRYVSGISFGVGIENGDSVTFGFRFLISSIDVDFNSESSDRGLVVNFVAAGIIYMLHHEIKSNSRERLRDEIQEIGNPARPD